MLRPIGKSHRELSRTFSFKSQKERIHFNNINSFFPHEGILRLFDWLLNWSTCSQHPVKRVLLLPPTKPDVSPQAAPAPLPPSYVAALQLSKGKINDFRCEEKN